MFSFLIVVTGIAFGPALLLCAIRLAVGPRAARATWRMALRWLYLTVLAYGGLMLARRVWIDGVLETDMTVQFGIAIMMMVLVAFSAAVSWTVAGTRWVRMDGTTILR